VIRCTERNSRCGVPVARGFVQAAHSGQSASGRLWRLPTRNALEDHAKQTLDAAYFQKAEELGADADLLAALPTSRRMPRTLDGPSTHQATDRAKETSFFDP